MDKGLNKQLGLLDIFCIASGAMISSGLFVLPGIASAKVGPALFLSYILASFIAVCIVFVLVGTKDERNFHLRALAAIAQICQQPDFDKNWLNARNTEELRDIVLLAERRRFEAKG
jgi:L-asparagine transporter-like permease